MDRAEAGDGSLAKRESEMIAINVNYLQGFMR